MNELLALRRHLAIVHHVPGRIRVRLGSGLQERAADLDPQAIEQLLCGLEPILSIRVNPLAASVVVQYDADRLPPSLWEGLLEGPDDQAAALAESLLRTLTTARQ